MPEYRARDFDRHEGGRSEFRLHAGVLQPHFLSDLSDSSRMVRQGSLGLRWWKYAHHVAAPAKGTLGTKPCDLTTGEPDIVRSPENGSTPCRRRLFLLKPRQADGERLWSSPQHLHQICYWPPTTRIGIRVIATLDCYGYFSCG